MPPVTVCQCDKGTPERPNYSFSASIDFDAEVMTCDLCGLPVSADETNRLLAPVVASIPACQAIYRRAVVSE